MKIYPGFSYMHRLFNGNGFHYFNLVIIDNQKYIVDCSYSQFFWLRQSMLERTGILGVASATPGRFMTLNDSRLETAKTILRDGWIKADEINLKNKYDCLLKELPFIHPDKYIFTSHKELFQADIKIDDKIENLENSSIKLLFSAWHNHRFTDSELQSRGVIRVNNWQDIKNILLK